MADQQDSSQQLPGDPMPQDPPTIQPVSGTSESGRAVVSAINRDFKERAVQEKAEQLGISYINLAKIPINPELLYLFTPEEARSGMIFPFFRIGRKLRIAVVEPENELTITLINQLKEKGYEINLNLTSNDSLEGALKLYESAQYRVKTYIKNEIDEAAIAAFEKEIKTLHDLKDRISSMTSEEALNTINVGAFKTGASDIHFQPEEIEVIVRFRIDGLLQEIFRIGPKVFENIANQLKYKAKMKLNIANVPQDGRYFFLINQDRIDVRVNSLPTEYGEAFVCRLLSRDKNLYEFEELGFVGHSLELARKTIGLSYGMILVTGPTGSGKTTTLYSMLGKYNTPEKKIITLEDPIEYNIVNVTQSQINQKRDYTFASGLRSVLRQDPDVVMIGEIRDLETAETAAQAALTGHVVLSTLHTNSAIETVPRLVNMGLPEFVIAPSLNTVIAQRLVRRICPNCFTESSITSSESKEIHRIAEAISQIDPSITLQIPAKFKRIQGCDICSHTGYKGQISLVEIINFDAEIKDLILAKASVAELFNAARRKKFLTKEEDGILKVIDGVTTLEEVHRVTKIL